jgi:tetratricopeptide (TPR) repeat protein
MANRKQGKGTIKGKGKEPELEVEHLLSRSEQFIEKNKKSLIYGVAIIAAIVGIILVYHHKYAIPLNERAERAMFRGEQYFERDSFALALFGNMYDFEGFETIVSQYGRTKSGNLAKAYAGICYYKLGDQQSAIKHLKSFRANDAHVSPVIIGLIGDCYVSIGNTKEGISYFEKAASKANDEIISPIYLKKAGLAYENLKQYKDAIRVYTAIKEKYNQSMEAQEIDKYIVRAELLSRNNN